MCQISSLMAAAEGLVAEFSVSANFEEEAFDIVSDNS